MADFERFVTAGEPALGLERGTVIARLREVSLDAEVATLDAYPAVTALMDVLNDGAKNLKLRPPGEPDTLRGTAAEMLDATKSHAEVRGNAAHWPTNAQSFSVQLDTCKGTLRKLGVDFEKLGRRSQRLMQVKLIGGPGTVRFAPGVATTQNHTGDASNASEQNAGPVDAGRSEKKTTSRRPNLMRPLLEPTDPDLDESDDEPEVETKTKLTWEMKTSSARFRRREIHEQMRQKARAAQRKRSSQGDVDRDDA